MSVFLKTLQVFHAGSSTPITITDDERINVKISQGASGSGFEVTLKNPNSEHVVGGEFEFVVDDTAKLFLKYADDNSEIDTSVSTDLILSTDITEFEATAGENETKWVLKCTDKTYLMMNRLWAYNYKKGDSWTAPTLIKEIIRINTTQGKGVRGQVNALLVSEGGYIQDSRPDGSSFPTLSMAKTFKPVYEWIEDLSQVEMINTATELTATSPPAPRPFVFYIDENNCAHWENPDTGSVQHHMTYGSTSAVSPDTNLHVIKEFKLKKAVFDIINMVIYNAGDDFYGSGILDYYYNPTTTSGKLKPVFRPFTDISKNLIEKDIFVENTAKYAEDNATPGTLTFQGKRYTATYPFTPHWTSTSVANDTELNASLKTAAVSHGDDRAMRLTQKRASPRWKGSITLKGHKYNVGELINFNSATHGIVNALVRITDVQHSIDKNGWTTTINCEEDSLPITN